MIHHLEIKIMQPPSDPDVKPLSKGIVSLSMAIKSANEKIDFDIYNITTINEIRNCNGRIVSISVWYHDK